MTLLYQAKDANGVDTFAMRCDGCGGQIGVQSEKAKPPPQRTIVKHAPDLQIR
jgi:hypothetical protein